MTDANQAIGAYPGSVLDILAVYVSSSTCMIVLKGNKQYYFTEIEMYGRREEEMKMYFFIFPSRKV